MTALQRADIKLNAAREDEFNLAITSFAFKDVLDDSSRKQP
jgi:hypothetical protein